MNNPAVNQDIWTSLRQKWDTLSAGGHSIEVEFNVLKDPNDQSRDLAIDVAQHIDGEWYVQTVQRQAGEADAVMGIEGLGIDQLIAIAGSVADSLTESVTGTPSHDDEMHVFMERISPEAAEIHGHVVTETGERIGVRASYRHYYVLNAILEHMRVLTREEYSGLELHRDRGDEGKVYFRFIAAN